ncbi:YARHG domain-containing protein [Bradyrhizobium sp. WD16]|uniref:YARHG domain-containing protein n=1 Tax=Bradyrhizobium sp. WD16 TaxID=1521768 RepID=UPI0020A54731|nr:YARHG domain-containing protein [Bradyrhizobium sp. WD16]UTD25663.1 YARHG domain-containing protein [Bradyrhizobium sp. WD16]
MTTPYQAAIAIVIALMATSPANAYSCSQLWHARNRIFKDAGYCFHTQRGIRAFGNAGCQYDNQSDVPLSDRDRDRINTIQRLERLQGCSD